jgi:transcriptional regulator with GAF, ATPase, and Fis domain
MSSDLIGRSSRLRAVLEEISIVAPVNSAVPVQGETGTGKEAIARAIHASSSRRHQALIAINCAAIPGHILQTVPGSRRQPS